MAVLKRLIFADSCCKGVQDILYPMYLKKKLEGKTE